MLLQVYFSILLGDQAPGPLSRDRKAVWIAPKYTMQDVTLEAQSSQRLIAQPRNFLALLTDSPEDTIKIALDPDNVNFEFVLFKFVHLPWKINLDLDVTNLSQSKQYVTLVSG